MFQRNFFFLMFIALAIVVSGCQQKAFQTAPTTVLPMSLRDVSALKLNFRFETDVPAPTVSDAAQTEERNAAVQNDFDKNRVEEVLDRTVTSPNKQRVLAVYHKSQDSSGDFRLDMYAPDGKILRRVSPDGMAVHYPDTIVWSSDSSDVAFMAMTRTGQIAAAPTPIPVPDIGIGANANIDAEANANIPAAAPNVEQPKPILTFRTEQIYISNSEGSDVKPITQNEGLIYFYFVWSPDSSALVALAATFQEWRYLNYQADTKNEVFTPAGRPRLVEKNGRERRLDDNLTSVHPAWSPDSAKVAVAFDKQVRIYDAIGDQPTQAAIPLRNQLLISSKIYDEDLQHKEQAGNSNAAANTSSDANATAANANTNANIPPTNQPVEQVGTLPDESLLVSFNPIIDLRWTEDKMLYVQTGYIKLMKNEADSARSYLRWHRLIFSPQATVLQ